MRRCTMATLGCLWLATLTRNSTNAGSYSPFVLIVNQDGADKIHHTMAGMHDKGRADLYLIEGLSSFDPAQLGNSSIRVGVRGNDVWRPQRFLLWGQEMGRTEYGAPHGLAMEISVTPRLSTDADEGSLSVPLRRVLDGGEDLMISRLAMVMTTKDVLTAGTDSPVNLTVTVGADTVVDYDIPTEAPSALERGQSNFYLVPVKTPFTKQSLAANGTVCLTILGNDAWRPARFFLFGLDQQASRPKYLVPLVHEPEWKHGWMSARKREGVPKVDFTLS
jgi:hypothetical protein